MLISAIIFQGKQLKFSKLELYKGLSVMQNYLRTQPILYYICVDSVDAVTGYTH